ncbi:MAG: hypothetical protein PHR30_18725 [Gallionellaceae bacterium]|nr:hypothetical protein [Gallionellaceae bacterium]
MELIEVKKGYADRLVADARFETVGAGNDGTARRRRAYIFRWPGDRLEGVLVAGPIKNTRRNASYIIQDGDEEVEFFGNQQLHTILPDLRGKVIRVEYVGWQRLPRCAKPRKVYRVFEVKGLGLLGPAALDEKTEGLWPDKLRRSPDDCD